MHAACLCVLKDDSNLYLLGHNLVRARHHYARSPCVVFAHHCQPARHCQVDADPESAVAWFAVGCYYYCIGRHKEAATFFSKAVALDPQCAPAWLGVGHAASITVRAVAGLARECCAVHALSVSCPTRVSCVSQNETDQAMAAYRTAARLFVGSHLPLLCMGMESFLTNSLPLADQVTHTAAGTTHLPPQCVPLTHTRPAVSAPIA